MKKAGKIVIRLIAICLLGFVAICGLVLRELILTEAYDLALLLTSVMVTSTCIAIDGLKNGWRFIKKNLISSFGIITATTMLSIYMVATSDIHKLGISLILYMISFVNLYYTYRKEGHKNVDYIILMMVIGAVYALIILMLTRSILVMLISLLILIIALVVYNVKYLVPLKLKLLYSANHKLLRQKWIKADLSYDGIIQIYSYLYNNEIELAMKKVLELENHYKGKSSDKTGNLQCMIDFAMMDCIYYSGFEATEKREAFMERFYKVLEFNETLKRKSLPLAQLIQKAICVSGNDIQEDSRIKAAKASSNVRQRVPDHAFYKHDKDENALIQADLLLLKNESDRAMILYQTVEKEAVQPLFIAYAQEKIINISEGHKSESKTGNY
ncbi:hypothetical protein [Fusibacter sp. 3D3]|uniref:hypothetical protein n=1 Tax=Fusibacter sp. 3D3 TaxID=1048380 RepID=UPI000852F3C6|nr:hypothetical protein [Fusibacter sp. 3D3]GAU79308.1 hypothetical protein F3D3_3967 [Fusibacter sp. 3D3]